MELIEAVQAENVALVRELLSSGTNVNQQDKYGWTPLNWAAGKGNLNIVKVLLDAGADPFKVGIDQRTALMIALAASHREVSMLLREVESRDPKQKGDIPERKYCMAYRRSTLSVFAGWKEKKIEKRGQEEPELTDSTIFYLHQDYVVTKSIIREEDVIFDEVTPEWKEFCVVSLKFRVPDDLELICPSTKSPDAESPKAALSAS